MTTKKTQQTQSFWQSLLAGAQSITLFPAVPQRAEGRLRFDGNGRLRGSVGEALAGDWKKVQGDFDRVAQQLRQPREIKIMEKKRDISADPAPSPNKWDELSSLSSKFCIPTSPGDLAERNTPEVPVKKADAFKR